MQLTFASYNIHKAVGLDRRRDPYRILAVLREIDADIVALQEVDRRFGRRESVLPHGSIEQHTGYRPVPFATLPDSLGWHGNALLVRTGIEVVTARVVPLPMLEPRGAIRADLAAAGRRIRVVGMHLDLSGLKRRQQMRSVLDHIAGCGASIPTVIMGDTNEWARRGGCFSEIDRTWHLLHPGRSFPTRRPLAQLDRIITSPEWSLLETGVHHSALSAHASDHLPVTAELALPNI